MSEFIPASTKFVQLPEKVQMKCGALLSGVRIAYETYGQLTSSRDNVILILTGLSPDAHVASNKANPQCGWWEAMVGAGKAIDTRYWYVICVNSLGSCKGSTGASSINPSTGEPYRLSFPKLAIEDIADTTAQAIFLLGFDKIACVIGLSMGGMTALSMLSRYPGIATHHINISSAIHALPFSIAIRSLQRESIRNDPNWNQGNYDKDIFPLNGMLLARKLGLISYRSAKEWEQRFGRNIFSLEISSNFEFNQFEIESYLQHRAHDFINCFDPNCYLYLSQSMDHFDLAENYNGDIHASLENISLRRALIIGVETDILFPIHQQRQIAKGLERGGTRVEFYALNSLQGHDAFLVDIDEFGPKIQSFLSAL
ncbi:homoserine O-acetyltransferase MetX [Xenorhabdus eapokensis]|uniref:Serine O-succinyltransferase n=1 Tax=Xenorhabdus eapokensis TaxID=1873482 RepID=A0A1Q5TFS5_9GAMM|nr:homoserine O-acetyltransferase [Xenorhabdus eapokensis]OKO99070.1 homoserine O-acetyltransferase [Xenorhabdus eapokensis]